jgi:tellurite resistance protein TerC
VTIGAAQKIIALAVGSTVLILGAAMIVLPGPGLVVIPLGLAVLAAEFIWARRLVTRLREEVRSVANSAIAAKPE